MDVILFHKGCTDGWCAAYVAQKRYPGAELFGVGYGDPLPIEEVNGKDVLVVDFSWRRQDVLKLNQITKSLTIYDHHKTAEKELDGLSFAYFDMKKSGAGLTWDMLFSNFTRPWYVNYIEDYDLWKFEFPESKAINAYLHSLPQTIEAWNELDKDEHSFSRALAGGTAILQYKQSLVNRQFENVQFGVWGKHIVGLVNASAEQSDLGHKIDSELPVDIAVLYYEDDERMVRFSLRSSAHGPDVSELAKLYLGGGHPHAAGFEMPYKDARKFVDGLLRKN